MKPLYLMSEARHSASLARHFRRGDILAAVGITLAFHALLLAVFRAEPTVKGPELPPPPTVMFIDLNAPDPTGQIASVRNFIFEHDPSLIPVGSRVTGFSRVLRAPAFRTPQASPQPRISALEALTVEAAVSKFEMNLPPHPETKEDAPLLSASLLGIAPVAAVYPFAELDGKPLEIKLAAPAAGAVAALPSAVTAVELTFEAPRSLPRIDVTRSCGDARLDAAALAACMPAIRAAAGKSSLIIYWREQ